VGPFEEEEEETGVASDVVKMEGEDQATPGPLERNDTWTATTPQYLYNKQSNTHTSLRCNCYLHLHLWWLKILNHYSTTRDDV